MRDKIYPELNAIVENINQDEEIIVFSPAHLEEIAVSEKREQKVDKEKIQEELNFLKQIAENHALRPITRDKLELFDEYPEDCYQRVLQFYLHNDYAEDISSEA